MADNVGIVNLNSSLEPGPPTLPDRVSGGHDWRLDRFPNLMPRRVEEILLVSSAYDSFILEEDGLLTELIFSEYMDLGLTHAPRVTRVSTGEEALSSIRKGHFDLVITMLRLGDMDFYRFGQAVRNFDPELPVVLLIPSDLEVIRLRERHADLNIASTYVWHGDPKIFLAIIKVIEDRWNAQHDTDVGSVGTIILVEDSVRFRSSLLPIIYSELVNQARSVMADGINRMHRLLRMRARPKILVGETYEEGMALYERFHEHLFGVIADVRFPRGGEPDAAAGLTFIRHVKEEYPDLPCLLQSSNPRNRSLAESIGANFLHKRSTTLLRDVREFMLRNFGFGDFVFRLPSGIEVARASDLHAMTHVLADVPAESLDYHARRNHFSNWLRARTEFELAGRLRPRQVSDFRDLEALRRFLIGSFQEALRHNRQGVVEDFTPQRFDEGCRFARIGGGSLGGKARGLAFFDAMMARSKLDADFPGVRIFVPRCIVIGTDVFDQFLEANGLRSPWLYEAGDAAITQAFLEAELPQRANEDLEAYVAVAGYPIAVRSSSLLEDSPFHPFAGVYATYMLPNNHRDPQARLRQLKQAVKMVFASTFFSGARQYLRATPYRIEEQKMAVIVQKIVGGQHEHYFYPSFAGVLRSYNFYPFGQMKPEDGVAQVALGLGALVVEGGEALRFSPAHPQILPQLADGKRFLDQSQRGFYAIDFDRTEFEPAGGERGCIARLELEDAERHGTLAPVGSVWSAENQAFYDGIYRPGVRVVTFAHVLKSDLFPLSELLQRVLKLGREGMNGPVEIEFAVDLYSEPKSMAILQIRPYAIVGESEPVSVEQFRPEQLLCYSSQALGNGTIDGIRDVIYVRRDRFDAAKTPLIAREVAALNEAVRAADRSCLLIGLGRWGSANPWLGIPVNWGQISSARVIVEASLDSFNVDPSQGSHFFHNLTSFGIAYLTVNPRAGESLLDWAWLESQPAEAETTFVRHVRLAEALETRVDGRSSRGVVLKRSLRARPAQSM